MLTASNTGGSSTWCTRIIVNTDDSLRLYANGNMITYQNGTAVILSGSSYCPYEELSHTTSAQLNATLNEMKNNWSMNAVRVVVFPQEWGPAYNTNNGYPSGRAMTYLDQFITACMRNGMYAIIEWHNYGTTDCYNITNPAIYDPCLWFWQNASKLYGNESTVMFELYNEPGWFPWSTWRSQAQNIANSIRQNSDNMIVVSGVRTAYYVKEVPSNPVTGTNIAYSTHCYADYTLYSSSWDEIMKPAAASVPVLMTEWGTAIWTSGMYMNDSIVHSYMHLLPYYMRDNGWDGSFAWNWDQTLGGTPMVYTGTSPSNPGVLLFTYSDWGKYARNVMLGKMPPFANMSVSGNMSAGSTIRLNDTLGWGVTAWDWDFGDSSAHGTARNATHVYSVPGNYNVTLTATNSSYAGNQYGPDVSVMRITVNNMTIPVNNTTTNNTQNPTVYYSSAQYSINENAGIITIQVNLGNITSLPVSVSYAVTGGNATAGIDYTGGSGTLNYAPGALAASFSINIMNNANYSGNRTIVLELSNPRNATVSTPSNTTITIVEDDTPIHLPPAHDATTFNISLVEGWNLISLPIVPRNNSIESLFPSSVLGGIVDIWGWDASAQNWLYYSPDPDDYFKQYYPAITRLETGMAYWVEMNRSASVTIEGTVPSYAPSSPLTPVSGWNFMGVTGNSACLPASMYPGAIDVWGWDESAQNWLYYSPYPDDYFKQYYRDIGNLQPGHGYWVEMP
jgi:hypothetical protein